MSTTKTNLPKAKLKSINGSWWLCLGENQIDTQHSSGKKGGYSQKQLREMSGETLKKLEEQLRKEGTGTPWA